MVKRDADPPRPTHDPPRTSWWTQPMSREQFDAAVKHEAERMNQVTVSYNKPNRGAHD